jgi:hypothetical protein
VIVLRKLNRERDVLPTLKKYAGRMPDALGVQSLYAKELAGVPQGRTEAESLYLSLAERFSNVEVYKGLFRLYQISGDMVGAQPHRQGLYDGPVQRRDFTRGSQRRPRAGAAHAASPQD